MDNDSERNYAKPGIAAQQREIVDRQLKKMKGGGTIPHFAVIGDALRKIKQSREFVSYGLLGATPHLLDAGCGSAYYVEIINHYHPGFVQYVGVDYNPEMVEMAQKHYPDLPIYLEDVRSMMFKNNSFDIVLSGACIIHITDWKLVLSEFCRVAAQWVILHRTYTYDHPTGFQIKDAYGVDVKYYTFNRRELLGEMQANDFDLVKAWNSGEGIRNGVVETLLFKAR
jgi:SAM-dependent methyltransferase